MAQVAGDELPWRRLTGLGQSWPFGGQIEWALAWDGVRGMRNPPGCSEQRSEAWDGMRGGGGGRTRRSIAGEHRSGLGKGSRASNSSA